MNAHPTQQPREQCQQGHQLAGDNLAIYRDRRPNGKPRIRRRCRQCEQARDRRRSGGPTA
jgi:hypothetical protein